jgi:hypothetical protein
MPAIFEGTYAVTVKSPVGEQVSTLELTATGGSLAGTQTTQAGECAPIYDLVTDGDTISWKTDIKSPISLTLRFEGILDGDNLRGKVKAGRLPRSPFRAVRR